MLVTVGKMVLKNGRLLKVQCCMKLDNGRGLGAMLRWCESWKEK